MAVVVFSWAPNLEPNIAGYKIYSGAATGTYNAPGSPTDVGNVTTATLTFTGNGPRFFALTAYNTLAAESAFSAELSGSFMEAVPGACAVAGATVRSVQGRVLTPRAVVTT